MFKKFFWAQQNLEGHKKPLGGGTGPECTPWIRA